MNKKNKSTDVEEAIKKLMYCSVGIHTEYVKIESFTDNEKQNLYQCRHCEKLYLSPESGVFNP